MSAQTLLLQLNTKQMKLWLSDTWLDMLQKAQTSLIKGRQMTPAGQENVSAYFTKAQAKIKVFLLYVHQDVYSLEIIWPLGR